MIAIIDYNAGNLTSVARALSYLGQNFEITDNPTIIEKADRIIFPGVGAAGSAMKSLVSSKMDLALNAAFKAGKPVLGICLGMQIIMEASHENDTSCLGLLEGEVRKFPDRLADSDGTRLKVPHMGWNRIQIVHEHPVFAGIRKSDEFYFVHGYYPHPSNESDTVAITDYGLSFASAAGRDNLLATQFHPEKSGEPGLLILSNFCKWDPA